VVELDITPPAGWTPRDLATPAPESAGVRLTRSSAWGATGGDGALAVVCHATDVGGYSRDADGLVNERVAAVASGAAERLEPGAGALGVVRADLSGEVRRVVAEGPRARAVGRWAFSREADGTTELASCVAVCAWRGGPSRACDQAVDAASLRGSLVATPAPTWTMRALGALTHHPARTLTGGALLVAALAFAAIVTRRRPRT
jgi:hypothetical protein